MTDLAVVALHAHALISHVKLFHHLLLLRHALVHRVRSNSAPVIFLSHEASAKVIENLVGLLVVKVFLIFVIFIDSRSTASELELVLFIGILFIYIIHLPEYYLVLKHRVSIAALANATTLSPDLRLASFFVIEIVPCLRLRLLALRILTNLVRRAIQGIWRRSTLF